MSEDNINDNNELKLFIIIFIFIFSFVTCLYLTNALTSLFFFIGGVTVLNELLNHMKINTDKNKYLIIILTSILLIATTVVSTNEQYVESKKNICLSKSESFTNYKSCVLKVKNLFGTSQFL